MKAAREHSRRRSFLSIVVVLTLVTLLNPSVFYGSDNCYICQKTEIAKNMAKTVKLKKSEGREKYFEVLATEDIKRYYYDWKWKEVALYIMNVSSGKIMELKIIREGQKIKSADPKFSVTIVPRFNGKTWNDWNTNYLVKSSLSDNSSWVVLWNVYPLSTHIIVNGKKKRFVEYAPFSEDILESPFKESLIKNGEEHLYSLIDRAYRDLAQKKAVSLSMPGKSFSDVVSRDFMYSLLIDEHCDPDEFSLDQQKTVGRILVIIAMNGLNAYALSGSSAGARGFSQFIESTYNMIQRMYPVAKLPSYSVGTNDQLEGIKAAILLADFNLSRLYRAFEKELVNRHKEEYLAASYNGGVGRVILAIREYKVKWDEGDLEAILEAKKKVGLIEVKIKTTQKAMNNASKSSSKKNILHNKIISLKKQLAMARSQYKHLDNAQLRYETQLYLLKFRELRKKTREAIK